MNKESELAHALNLFGDTLTSCEQESLQTLILDYFEPDESDPQVEDLSSDDEFSEIGSPSSPLGNNLPESDALFDNGSFNNSSVIVHGSVGDGAEDENQEEDAAPDFQSTIQLRLSADKLHLSLV